MTEWEMKYYHMNKLASDLNIGCARMQGERDGLRKSAQMALEWFDWLNAPDGPISPPHTAKDVRTALRKELSE